MSAKKFILRVYGIYTIVPLIVRDSDLISIPAVLQTRYVPFLVLNHDFGSRSYHIIRRLKIEKSITLLDFK